jgi:anti-anti-sigma regulatory factor
MTAIRVVWLGQVVLLWADGVLGGAAAAELHAAMEGLLRDAPETMVVDLSGVAALDDGATAVLAAAAARMSFLGATLELRLPGARAVTIAGAAQLRTVLATSYPPASPTAEP